MSRGMGLRASLEVLESRQLLYSAGVPTDSNGTGSLTATVGDTLYTSKQIEDPVNSTSTYTATIGQLWKSNLDGSNATLVRSFPTYEPMWLTSFHNQLYFSAADTGVGQELWVSNGTAAGTQRISRINIQPGSYGSSPNRFMIVHDQLFFYATEEYHRELIFTTNGSGVSLVPAETHIDKMEEGAIGAATVYNDTLYFYQYGNRIAAGATSDPSGGVPMSGTLDIYGTAGNDNITLSQNSDTLTLSLNGRVQTFPLSGITKIKVASLAGNDVVQLDPSVTLAANIYDSGGSNTLIGGSGDDAIDDNPDSADYIDGGAGNDSIEAGYFSATTLLGGDGNDTLSGGKHIEGNAGDDKITEFGDSSSVDGGAGNDSISGSAANSTIHGGDGNDTIIGGYGNDSIYGDDGDDSLDGVVGDDYLNGGAGADTLNGGPGIDTIISDADDTVTDPSQQKLYGSVFVDGTRGDDVIDLRAKPGDANTMQIEVNGVVTEWSLSDMPYGVTLSAYEGNDTITVEDSFTPPFNISGGAGDDVIVSHSPRQNYSLYINGGDGTDTIDTADSPGFYIIDTGDGDDSVSYGSGRTIIDNVIHDPGQSDDNTTVGGSGGTDTTTGSGGSDSTTGSGGADTTTGSTGGDSTGGGTTTVATPTIHASLKSGVLRLYGTAAADSISLSGDSNSLIATINGVSQTFANVSSIIAYGGAGNDRIDLGGIAIKSKLYGEAGNDVIYGGAGKDRIYGGDGDDWISGGDNHDTIYGQAGNDKLFGDAGHDYLVGGAGANTLRGGDGIDHLIFTSGDDIHANAGDKMTVDDIVG